jgi:1-acyl-sn-glycerol-3-phosphate acyltransferase
MAAAETPADLVVAIRTAAPAPAEYMPVRQELAGPGTAAPAHIATLVDLLEAHAQAQPERLHILLRQEDGTEIPITYGALWERAAVVAADLRERGIGRGQSVALMLRTEAAFFESFFGILIAGAVPVPLYPPFRRNRIEEYARRQAGILRNAEARLLITFGDAERVAYLLRRLVPALTDVITAERPLRSASRPVSRRVSAQHPALIQYTSGSTGDPKGVLLSHANILANIRAIGEALAISPTDVGVSWLPLYHDMGLIGAWLGSLYFGIPIVLLSPLAFLARPARWLWAIHAHRATISPAPNFAFDLCVRRVTDEEIAGLDLSSWRLALNGSEPVSPDTIERFTRRFQAYGFRPEAMCPVYGLAEASVGLTMPPLGRGPWVDHVARDVFQWTRQAQPAAPDDPTSLRFVSCGRALPGHAVRVVDATGHRVSERIEGRIEFRGPAVTSGYFRNPEATRAVRRNGWMDSGDLGYHVAGELFVTGRQKDLIIKGGRNLSPQEVEEVVGDLPGIRKGCVAAFGVADPAIGTERFVVVAESRERLPQRQAALRSAVRDRVVTVIGVPADTVIIAEPGTVLKTSSGKIRRTATREAYLGGALGRARPSGRVQWVRLWLQAARARARRTLVGGGRLGYALYVSVVLAATLPLLWGLVLVMRSGAAIQRMVRMWCRMLLGLSGCRLRVQGLAHLREATPAVLAANHASYLDAVVLLATLPVDFRFVAKRELLGWPLVGSVIRKVGHLTVERGDPLRSTADAQRATAMLARGASLLFFPEGTFRQEGGLLPFRLGAFKAAVETGYPVVPIGLAGTREVLPAEAWLPRPGPITVTVGSPLYPEGREWQDMVRLRDTTRAQIAALTGEQPIMA